MKDKMKSDKDEKIARLAAKVMGYARDSILVNMRFLDVALSGLAPEQRQDMDGFACDGVKLYYNPLFLLKKYREEPAFAVRMYLHVLFHLIFYHSFRFDKVDGEVFSLAADMAAEAAILELDMPGMGLIKDEEKRRRLQAVKEDTGALTAEKIYRYIKNFEKSAGRREELSSLFFMDSHRFWKQREELAVSMEQWKKLSERVQADLKSFSAGKSKSESMEKSLFEAVKDRTPYRELLRKFTVMNEDMQVNDDEFDYIYYTYGLSRYGNMPLVEPLEYKDSRKVKEFVIAIDTSASCRGELVKSFLRSTYAILSGEETFFKKINVHIIQCDHEVRRDTKITGREDLDYFLAHEKLTGFGATDFRPVFSYVEQLREKGEFEKLKGLLYFTDGYGIYPTAMPPYEVMFVFPDNGDEGPQVPPWAVRVMLSDEEIG
ncbi:MAG: VWA-like domain-containing protein [Clostridium sp.]|nr:VWA-like domain-containing protein [Clostridium sp.]